MRAYYLVLPLLLAACTPAEQVYCQRMGTPPGSSEYGRCVSYFFQQSALFDADNRVCSLQADQVYPPMLYDTWHDRRVIGGIGPDGRIHGDYTVEVQPDYYHNRLVDNLRMNIIAPCMMQHGWRSPVTWEAGRQTPIPGKVKSQALPWRN